MKKVLFFFLLLPLLIHAQSSIQFNFEINDDFEIKWNDQDTEFDYYTVEKYAPGGSAILDYRLSGEYATQGTYIVKDEEPAQGWNYYYIKCYKNNGTFFSSQVQAKYKDQEPPTISNGKDYIQIASIKDVPEQYRVIDFNGRVIESGTIQPYQRIEIKRQNGFYFLQIGFTVKKFYN